MQDMKETAHTRRNPHLQEPTPAKALVAGALITGAQICWNPHLQKPRSAGTYTCESFLTADALAQGTWSRAPRPLAWRMVGHGARSILQKKKRDR